MCSSYPDVLAWGHRKLDLCHLSQDSAAVKNTTPPLQPSAEAPLKGKPRRECYCMRRNFSRQDLLSPGPSGYNNLLEDILCLWSFRGRQISPYNCAEAIMTFKSRAYSNKHRDTYINSFWISWHPFRSGKRAQVPHTRAIIAITQALNTTTQR